MALSIGIGVVTSLLNHYGKNNSTFVRLLPLIPVLLGAIAGPFVFTYEILINICVGITAGAVSGHSYKIFKQSVKKNDQRLKL